MQKEYTIFDETDVFQEEIEPLLEKIEIICKAKKIPFFFTACIRNTEDESKYVHDGNLCGSNEIVLKDDKITDMLRVICGFKVESEQEKNGGYTISPPGDILELTEDEF